jgi:hypothetical protein
VKGAKLTAYIASLGFTVTVAGPHAWFVYSGDSKTGWFEVFPEDLAFRLGTVNGSDCIDLLTFSTELMEANHG